MTAKAKTFLTGSLVITIVLLVSVPFCDFILSFFFDTKQAANDSTQQLLAGMAGESVRAFITCYLYSVTEQKGSRLIHGIIHGLLYSALIGSLYLVLGYFYFQVKSPLRFLIADSFILLIQGIASGAVLYIIYRPKT
jgi:hypothetical protein